MSNELKYVESDEGVHFYQGCLNYMEEGTLCGIGCDNPDIRDTEKKVVTCQRCIRILKILRSIEYEVQQ